jgi:hypothetical protein
MVGFVEAAIDPERDRVESLSRSIFLFEHDLFGKTGTPFFRIML